MAQNFKHNKKRNTGLVYEFLVRRLSQTMLDGNKDAQRTTLGIIRKYYDIESGPLSEERELFEVVKNTRGVSESVARQVLNEVQRAARKMDANKIDIKKSNLIKEINYAFGQDFWDEHRIPDYRVLASIQMVIDASRGGASLTESISKIQLEEGLVQFMVSKGGAQMLKPVQSEVDSLVMRMVAKRFEEKYKNSLNSSQKKMLERYIRLQVTGDERPFKEYMAEEAQRISKSLDKATTMREVIEDAVMTKKLDEARTQWLRFIGGTKTPVQMVEETMVFQKLVEELESDE